LRKKLEPQVENWVEEGRTAETGINGAAKAGENEEELWSWAQDWIGMRVARYALEEAGDNYTVEEREKGIENINTGLRRTLDEDESSEEEDEDEEMEDVGMEVTSARRSSMGQVEFGMTEVKKEADGKSRSRDEILRFATSGVVVDQVIGGNR
jgi:mediator of RNA polymerase II transcription subunit 8